MKAIKLLTAVIIVIIAASCEEYDQLRDELEINVVDSVYYQEIDRQWAKCELKYDTAYYSQFSNTDWVCFVINDSIVHELTEQYYEFYYDMVDYCGIDINIRKCGE